MNVALPPEFVPFVDELVSNGVFPTEEAVVGEALRRWRDDQTRFNELKKSFDDAIEELDRTGGTPLDFDEIKRKVRDFAATRGQ